MRGAFLPAILAAAVLGFALAFLAQRDPRLQPPGPVRIARLAEVSAREALAVSVRMPRGIDRILQRDRYGVSCVVASMGCPGATPVSIVRIYLVRDGLGTLHAFIGEDPRNGCALEWRSEIDRFHDRCHGSLYDRADRPVGGPSPFALNGLTVTIADSDVFVDPKKIVVGHCDNITYWPCQRTRGPSVP